jgi:hypothetical protein
MCLEELAWFLKTHERSLYWLGSETSIRSGHVKLVLWTQTFPFSEMMWSGKCFSNVSKMLILKYN